MDRCFLPMLLFVVFRTWAGVYGLCFGFFGAFASGVSGFRRFEFELFDWVVSYVGADTFGAIVEAR